MNISVEISATLKTDGILTKESSSGGIVVSGAIVTPAALRLRLSSGRGTAGLTSKEHEVDFKPGPLQTKGAGTQPLFGLAAVDEILDLAKAKDKPPKTEHDHGKSG